MNASDIVYALVAGASTAVFRLPPDETTLNPVLFEAQAAAAAPPLPVLVGAVALSCVVSCRYAPLPR